MALPKFGINTKNAKNLPKEINAEKSDEKVKAITFEKVETGEKVETQANEIGEKKAGNSKLVQFWMCMWQSSKKKIYPATCYAKIQAESSLQLTRL